MFDKFLSIFKSSTGNYDLGRILSLKFGLVFSGGFAYSLLKLHQTVNWMEAGGGFSAVMLGIGGLIGIKEVAVAKAQATNPATTPGVVVAPGSTPGDVLLR